MSLNADIRDRAYQFFVEEAQELLQVLEEGLLDLKDDRSTPKVHQLMRAAHSLKGGAASVELEAIKIIAHRLEDYFKALYSDRVSYDTNLESLFLDAYDCLRAPLQEQILTGTHDSEAAITKAQPVFEKIEAQLGDVLKETDTFIPSSTDLGVDMVGSLFEVDVANGIDQLQQALAQPDDEIAASELRAQAELFSNFAELFNLPGFGAILQTALAALDLNPSGVREIIRLTVVDCSTARESVLAGERERGGSPSDALIALARSNGDSNSGSLTDEFSIFDEPLTEAEAIEDSQFLENIFSNFNPEADSFGAETKIDLATETDREEDEGAFLEEVFSNFVPAFEVSDIPETQIQFLDTPLSEEDEPIEEEKYLAESARENTLLERVFGDFAVDSSASDVPEIQFLDTTLSAENESENDLASLDRVFSGWSNDNDAESLEEPILEEVFGEDKVDDDLPAIEDIFGAINDTIGDDIVEARLERLTEAPIDVTSEAVPQSLDAAAASIEDIFTSLTPVADPNSLTSVNSSSLVKSSSNSLARNKAELAKVEKAREKDRQNDKNTGAAGLFVRVDLQRLDRMNNLVGELAIERNSLALQNEQLQATVRELRDRFSRFQDITSKLRSVSDEMLVRPQFASANLAPATDDWNSSLVKNSASTSFDALEMDNYGEMYTLLQGVMEEIVQLEESVEDISLYAQQSNQSIEGQRQMLKSVRDELMWARMLPLSQLLQRFPRIIRDLSMNYHKPVKLEMIGTNVLVDKAVLEKLYDPLLHLLRNGFDHGIEPTEARLSAGKPEQGTIQIEAYYQGNQTIIEIRDDGKGIDYQRIAKKAIQKGFLSPEAIAVTSKEKLLDLIFEPGFSTASRVSELSGRGVGLNVVRSQLRALKGTVAVNSSPGLGTSFILRLPLTLTVSKLLVCSTGMSAIALPSDSIEEIIIPKAQQIKITGERRFVHWRERLIPIDSAGELLSFNYPIPDNILPKAFDTVIPPEDWRSPLLLLKQGQRYYALEVERLIVEQESIVKPFGAAIAAPSYTYGCTILGDGTLLPVVNGVALIESYGRDSSSKLATRSPNNLQVWIAPSEDEDEGGEYINPNQTIITSSILVVDDSAALRRTLALTLEKNGYRVLQAKDGKEALEVLKRSTQIDLVICDIEMPNMNGFEFLGVRRRDPELAKIPVAMLTSRSNDKHRNLAIQLGAVAYFTKPYIEQEFLAEIKKLALGS
jgi:two-component system, chemotaxis family, sensor histidine kinase and response regulator PixL